MDTLPWIEKYRPIKLDDIISHSKIIYSIKKFIENNNLPHLLLYGPSGTGKTSLVNAIINEIYGDNVKYMTLSINASEERGIDVVRTKILDFVMTKPFENNTVYDFKVVILDEVDAMTQDAQSILRKVIEKYTKFARFFLVCNFIKKINMAIISRCVKFKFVPLKKTEIKNKLIHIAREEDITIDNDCFEYLVYKSNGDMRMILNILQSTSMSYDNISIKNINKCFGFLDKKTIDSIYNVLENDTFEICFDVIRKNIYDKGFSLKELLTELIEIIKEKHKNDEKLLDLWSNLGTFEYTLGSRNDDLVHIGALIGIFKLFYKK